MMPTNRVSFARRAPILLGVGLLTCPLCVALPSQPTRLIRPSLDRCRPSPQKDVWASKTTQAKHELKLRGGSGAAEVGVQQHSLFDLYQRCRFGPSAAVETASNCIRRVGSMASISLVLSGILKLFFLAIMHQAIYERLSGILAEPSSPEINESQSQNAQDSEVAEDEHEIGPLQELLEVENRRLALGDLARMEEQIGMPDLNGLDEQIDRAAMMSLDAEQQQQLAEQRTDAQAAEYAHELNSELLTPGGPPREHILAFDELSDDDELSQLQHREEAGAARRQRASNTPGQQHRDGAGAADIEEVLEGNGAAHDSMQESETPAGLTTKLMMHQRMSLAWMQRREEAGRESSLFWEKVDLGRGKSGFVNFLTGEDRPEGEPPLEVRGGILADDMGLGKTLTVLALVVSELFEGCGEGAGGGKGGAGAGKGKEEGVQDEEGGLVKGMKQLKLSELFQSCVAADGGGGEAAEEGGGSVAGVAAGGGGARAAGEEAGGGELRRREGVGPTLIVCPLSVMHNWQQQIGAHATAALRVLVYHGAGRCRSREELGRQDVVLTTYATLSAEYSRAVRERRAGGGGGGGSVLHSVDWWRLVLDEAHVIANPKAKQSKAAAMLGAGRRWAVTGTPLQNKMEDLFSLFHFLKLDPLDDFTWFSRLIKDPLKAKQREKRDNAMILVRTVLGVYCLRRTKDQEIRGKPIVVLPRKRILLRELELSPEERALYDRMFESGKRMFRSLMRTGTVMTHYTQILTRLLRLRQLCCHPWLLPTEVADGASAGGRGAADEKEVEALAEVMEERLAGGAEECCVCLEAIEEPVITRCRHIFCRACMARCLHELRPAGNGAAARGIACPLCRGVILPEEVVEMPIRIAAPARQGEAGALAQSEEEGGGGKRVGWESSTKMEAVLRELREVQAAHPGEKVVIFSQFTSFLDILQEGLERGGVEHLRLDGTMRREARQAAVEQFQEEAGAGVLLVSIKSGGTGINLVAANHVFFTDLWWNRAVEEQAMDRVHRMGQRREVRVVRFVVKGTIEERIVELQEKKMEMIRGAMGGASSGRLHHARTADLQVLFR